MEPTPDPELAELHPVELNPYAPPSAPIKAPPAAFSGDPERARHLHLGRENSVKLAGAFCYVGAIVMTAFSSYLQLQKPQAADANVSRLMGGLIGGLLLGAIPIAVGNGLKALRTWARWTVVALAPFVLLYCLLVGVAGLFSGVLALGIAGCAFAAMAVYMMLALLLPGASTLFTPEYRAIVAATPHIKAWAEWAIRAFSAVFLLVVGVLLVIILRKI